MCGRKRGHVDPTQRQRASTLASRVVIVPSRVVAACVPLDSEGELRILHTCSCTLHYTVLKHLWLLKAGGLLLSF